MKRLTSLFLVAALVAATVFASGEGEGSAEAYDWTVLTSGMVAFSDSEAEFMGAPGIIEKLANDFMEQHPNVTVSMVYRDISQGSLTFDTMLAAGRPPAVWLDASHYFPKYLNEDYAIRLNSYVDVDKYDPDLLQNYTIDGNVYALPFANIALGMAVNVSMLREVGLELPAHEDWTLDNYLLGAAALKLHGYTVTAIQGKGGFNGWTDAWFYAHGAAMFAPGDWSKVTINSPEGLKTLGFIQTLIDEGYTDDPLAINDDEFITQFAQKETFSGMMQNGHIDPRFPSELEKGNIDSIPEYTFIEFPREPHMDHAPVSAYQTVASAHKSGDETEDALIAEFTRILAGEESQYYYAANSGGFPTIKGVQAHVGYAATDSYKAIAELSRTAGVYKQWPDGPIKDQIRRLWQEYTEQWLRGNISSEDMLAQFEAEANAKIGEILAK
jgi:ABC-type glycerol-3-phosphate transport system substrate-binding protein